jgi:hypothetical protein
MKIWYLLIFCSCTAIIHGQNAKITIGRGTNCFGRGACSIELVENSKAAATSNAVFDLKKNQIVLRIFREKLNQDEHARLFGQPITSENNSSLQFIMDEAIDIPAGLKQHLFRSFGKTVHQMKKGTYTTNISKESIEITLFE